MLPFTVPSDTLTTAFRSEPITFRIRLHLSSIDDLRGPPTLHGFHGTVSLARPWQYSAQCITKVHVDGVCTAEEVGALQLVAAHSPNSNGMDMVQAFLPESSLTRCRWLDASAQTCISQHIIVDDVTLAFIIYDLDRKDTGSAPKAHLIHRSRLPNGIAPSLLSPLLPSSHFSMAYSQGPHVPLHPRTIRRPEPTSLSCALIPVSHTLNASMLY